MIFPPRPALFLAGTALFALSACNTPLDFDLRSGNVPNTAEAARAVSGQCDEAPLVMGGEDFAYMLEERPGAYILMGNGDTAKVHSPDYNFNDNAIPAGCSWWAEIVEQRMPA